MYRIDSDTTEKQIYDNHDKKVKLKRQIKELKAKLKQVNVDGYLLNAKLNCPLLLPINESIGKYKFLSRGLTLPKLGIELYPIWLTLQCTYPEWSRDILSINIIEPKTNEPLIDGICKGLNISYSDCQTLLKHYDIEIPLFYIHEHVLGSNLKIDFSRSEPIQYHKHKRNVYFIESTDDKNMVLNLIQIKVILVLPFDLLIDVI